MGGKDRAVHVGKNRVVLAHIVAQDVGCRLRPRGVHWPQTARDWIHVPHTNEPVSRFRHRTTCRPPACRRSRQQRQRITPDRRMNAIERSDRHDVRLPIPRKSGPEWRRRCALSRQHLPSGSSQLAVPCSGFGGRFNPSVAAVPASGRADTPAMPCASRHRVACPVRAGETGRAGRRTRARAPFANAW